MSSPPPTRASELAARQVEQIVAAAQEAAEQIRQEARLELQELRERVEREGEEIRESARREVEQELNAARKEAILLTQDARRDAEGLMADAREESTQIKERTERAVQGRVAAAERAAAEVLAEAHALSGGLQQLGSLLEGHAERILRDVAAAHKRMQADLRAVAGGGSDGNDQSSPPGPAAPARASGEVAKEERGRSPAAPGRRFAPGRRPSANPFDDLEVPSWER